MEEGLTHDRYAQTGAAKSHNLNSSRRMQPLSDSTCESVKPKAENVWTPDVCNLLSLKIQFLPYKKMDATHFNFKYTHWDKQAQWNI
ncbi:hypothetical protein MKW98_020954 [Papaver atlanticum]|uniref:Uncharacterized protein n=1 Tax=Papaver atlanticum TaxID=357466 RepID=A0AAD4XVI1_9MAGN|nr:hypothetical protein MKW98_020954 [Papaver atlanticum]